MQDKGKTRFTWHLQLLVKFPQVSDGSPTRPCGWWPLGGSGWRVISHAARIRAYWDRFPTVLEQRSLKKNLSVHCPVTAQAMHKNFTIQTPC